MWKSVATLSKVDLISGTMGTLHLFRSFVAIGRREWWEELEGV